MDDPTRFDIVRSVDFARRVSSTLMLRRQGWVLGPWS